jgi:hypothetical protein
MSTSRPTSVAVLKEAMAGFITDESRSRARAFKLRPSDVVISPYGKCGTTFLQQTVHGLRTRGNMEFREINEAVPWLETAHDLGLDLEAPQPEPRAFKSHMNWDDVPKGGRYIVSFRNPIDRFVSFYRFFEGWWFERGTITFSDYMLNFALDMGGHRSYWRHLKSWWGRRNDPNVLLLCFEDMTTDLGETVRKVAEFCRIPLDPELQRIVETQSSRDFMTANRMHFDDHLMRERSESLRGFRADGGSHKVRSRKIGEKEFLVTEDVVHALDDLWRDEVTAELGFSTYDNFQLAVKEASSASDAGLLTRV